MGKKKKKAPSNIIAKNKRASYEYMFLEDFEAGLSLLGWEVKSLRQGKISFNESFILLKNSEAFLHGAHITPLLSASTHIEPDPRRYKKLLLHQKEISLLIGSIERKGLTLVPRMLYWKNGKVKVLISLAKGKKLHDKRQAEKQKDWNLNKQRMLKENR
jgi:SsrA-binding protein